MTSKLLLAIVCVFIPLFFVHIAYGDITTIQATVTNSPPVASSVQIAAGNLNSGEIALAANQTTQINITATITDSNGCSEVTGVNATLFRTTVGSGAVDNNQNHYSIVCSEQTSSCSGGADISATYDCLVNVSWYADPTDTGSAYASTNWTVNVTPNDGEGAGTSGTAVYDLQTTTSFSLQTTSLNFGSLALGDNTSFLNSNVTIENHGNEPIDLSLHGYGSSDGDGLSMTCAVGTIPVGNLEHDDVPFTYGAGVDMKNETTELDFDLDRGHILVPRPSKDVAFGFGIPASGVGGSCNGNVVIVAISDPTTD